MQYSDKVLYYCVFICWLVVGCSGVEFRRVCYFRQDQYPITVKVGYEATDVRPHLCTHLIYWSAVVGPNGAIALQDQNDSIETENRFREFNFQKSQHPQLKTLLSVGGSNQIFTGLLEVMSTEENRKNFATNAMERLRYWQFDGLHIDWTYPGLPNVKKISDTLTSSETKQNFTLLLKELKAVFKIVNSDKEDLILSVTGLGNQEQVKEGFEIKNISSLVDFIDLKVYDFADHCENITKLHSPMYERLGDVQSSSELSVYTAVSIWLSGGADAEKLVLGVTGNGLSFRLANGSIYGVGAPTSDKGRSCKVQSMLSHLTFSEVCTLMKEGFKSQWDELQHAAYAYKNDQWMTYDDRDSIIEKVKFAVGSKLGGITFWTVDSDDVGAVCKQGRYPLLNAIAKVVGVNAPVSKFCPRVLRKSLSPSFECRSRAPFNTPNVLLLMVSFLYLV